MKILKTQALPKIVNSYMIDSPRPSNISLKNRKAISLSLCMGIFIIPNNIPEDVIREGINFMNEINENLNYLNNLYTNITSSIGT